MSEEGTRAPCNCTCCLIIKWCECTCCVERRYGMYNDNRLCDCYCCEVSRQVVCQCECCLRLKNRMHSASLNTSEMQCDCTCCLVSRWCECTCCLSKRQGIVRWNVCRCACCDQDQRSTCNCECCKKRRLKNQITLVMAVFLLLILLGLE